MKIVFMGTPEFALPSLETLHNSSHKLVSVVTVPDKPVGRGRKVQASPVKRLALDYGLPVLQPADLKAPKFLEELQKLEADLFVVVAFRILPPEVFELPPKGTINLHASLLPKYRGAAPINWAIINGETETGLTTFFIQEKVDTGEIIFQKKVSIGEDETAGELHDRLARLGGEVVLETVDLIEEGKAQPSHQEGEVTKAPKITKELCQINWKQSNRAIRNLIRGLSPNPGAYTFLNGKILKVLDSKPVDDTKDGRQPGKIVNVDSKAGFIEVAAGKGHLRVTEVQSEGKRRMSASEFLRGHSLREGEILG